MLQCEINLISRTYALKVKFRKLGGGGVSRPRFFDHLTCARGSWSKISGRAETRVLDDLNTIPDDKLS